ncbi:MAG TPA: MBL fold metallo-hydrolase [Candidatus Omnitrophota bacterium]|jgi:7,8-dihydropterin-6-yl-methyl-4-(beta-D-ribofuranosyl)aminobenzene 5'-phosphate synthase|nr:MBL fold metallo-hydrolase [Candidatus Omnitrophota bacterium]
MKIKIIATGSSKLQRFIRRWGVSFLIGEDVLFDTFGDPGVLMDNMRKFKVDTAKIKHIVLSHDDWDHITGLWCLLPNRQDITVYICPGFKREIKDRIASFGVKLIEAGEPVQIKDDIYTAGELYGESRGRGIHEQSVVVKTSDGLAVVCGCAHPGVVNIVMATREHFKIDVNWLIGGFHLKDNTDENNKRIIDELQQLGIRRIAPLHCTGKRASEMISKALGQGFIQVKEGGILDLDLRSPHLSYSL